MPAQNGGLKARDLAALSVERRIALLGEIMSRLAEEAEDWVRDGCAAKGIDPDSPMAAEEWFAGPVLVMRNLRLLRESLDSIRQAGRPPLGTGARIRPDGRVLVRVFPADARDALLFRGITADVLLRPGVSEAEARERQAAFYRAPHAGRVTLILGAGNVSAIPAADVLHHVFVEGSACILKVNPVNEWVGPHLERVFAPLSAAGALRIVYGGADAGAALVADPAVDAVHITGSAETHDRIVWGPAGPERERRRAAREPLLRKPITSELGNVSPVAIFPCRYRARELRFLARNVVTMVVNNASFNCNAAKILVTGRFWPQREEFLNLLRATFAEAPTRRAYYPGARERYQSLLCARGGVERFGSPAEGDLPWALVPGLDAADPNERLFRTEAFCGLLGEVPLDAEGPAFLDRAAEFMNERLWGTLCAMLVLPPRLEREREIAEALDRALLRLRYGTVSVNLWPAVAYGIMTPPWGGHPSGSLEKIESGLGWVHNTFLLDGVEKTILRGPVTMFPYPPWFFDARNGVAVARRLFRYESSPGWRRALAVATAALF